MLLRVCHLLKCIDKLGSAVRVTGIIDAFTPIKISLHPKTSAHPKSIGKKDGVFAGT